MSDKRVDVFFGELMNGYKREARAKVARELRNMKADLKKYENLRKNFEAEVKKRVEKAMAKFSAREKKVKEKERNFKAREQAIRDAEAHLSKELKAFEKIKQQKVTDFIRANGGSYSWGNRYTGDRRRRAVTKLLKKRT